MDFLEREIEGDCGVKVHKFMPPLISRDLLTIGTLHHNEYG